MDRLTDRQKSLIINNVVKACKNINNLNSTGYKFISLANGFIAHYNLLGFKCHYSASSLKDDIMYNARNNQWHNFNSNDKDYGYYMDKKEIYNNILIQIDN